MVLTAASWITEIIESIVAVFTDLGTAILEFIKTAFTTLFLDTSSSTTKLSNFAIFVFILMGISLVMGLTYAVFNVVRRSK